jgi:dihydroneopterin aldolase
VDLELRLDSRQAAESDMLKDTVDLYKAFELVEGVIVSQKFRLIETMAERIADTILAEFDVPEVLVRVRKPHAPIRGIQDGIEIEIRRSNA